MIDLVYTQTLTGECSCVCLTQAEADAKRSEEIERLLEHHPPEVLLDAALAVEHTPEREVRIMAHGNRANYEHREVADALWESAPARMRLDAERAVAELAELGTAARVPEKLTIKAVRALKSRVAEERNKQP